MAQLFERMACNVLALASRTSPAGHQPHRAGDAILLRCGSSVSFFLAGQADPVRVLDAASVDGANAIQQFFRITIPLLSPVILFNLVIQMIGAFQAFTQAYVIGGGRGGVLNSTLFYTLHMYIQGWAYHEMGYASAMAWVLLIIIGVLTR